jgi:hypothetical protein
MSHLATAERAIRAQIATVTEQIRRLETALAHLDGDSTAQTAQRRKPAARRKPRAASSRRRRPTRSRMAPAEREQQLLGIIGSRPGISQSDLAGEAGVTSAHVSVLIKKLVGQRKVKRADGGLMAT